MKLFEDCFLFLIYISKSGDIFLYRVQSLIGKCEKSTTIYKAQNSTGKCENSVTIYFAKQVMTFRVGVGPWLEKFARN